ncbi:MAG: sulfatase-like hydrolase/transferase [Planctomycetes bacterium]|nr:sulfatase-like hydrolase/transferase [Planctomycetota bacterium]
MNISRREFVRHAALGTAGAMVAPASLQAERREEQPRRPNFLYLMSDQQHWQALGCQDAFFDTPHLDRFAADATLFDRAFCTTPQCSPSRSSMLTGLYPSKTGVMGNVGATGGDKLAAKTIGAMLQEAGYHTAYHGKWHLGGDPGGNAGWDEQNTRANDEQTTARSVEFLQSDRAGQEPFAMVVSYTDPHDIYHFRPGRDKPAVPNITLPKSWHEETFADKPPIHRQFMTDDQGKFIHGAAQDVWEAYHDFYRQKVRLVDRQMGQVLEALRAAGLWEDTIIIIGSDHGDMDTHHRLVFKGPFMYEQMVRVPLLIRVPGTHGGVRRGRIADYDTVNVDLVPTIREFAGMEPIATDGLSLRPLLTGAAEVPRREFVIGQYHGKQRWVNPIRMIRTAGMKYMKYIDHGEELYDLENDPHELVNLAGDPARRKSQRELAAELDRWIAANDDPFYGLKTVPLKR